MKYQQLCNELRTQSLGWRVKIVPLVNGCLGNMRSLHDMVDRCVKSERVHWVATEMQRVVVYRADTIAGKIEWINNYVICEVCYDLQIDPL